MKMFKVRLKHDTGFVTVFVSAANTDKAIVQVCKAEKAPITAVRSVRLAR